MAPPAEGPAGLPGAPESQERIADQTRRLAPATVAVTAGRPPRTPGQPTSVGPILTTTFMAGGEVAYSRHGNPTWTALEDALAALEGPGTQALSFGSGMAAIHAVAATAGVGTTVVVPGVAYNGTLSLLDGWASEGRIRLVHCQPDAAKMLAAASDVPGRGDAGAGAPMIWVETPTNPTMDVIDIAALAEGARAIGATLVVDSTFATPLGQRPLDLGADVVVHSATKYLSGHSDILLGAAVTRDQALLDRLHAIRTLVGGVPGPMEAWLALRGLRTFPLRWERACANAAVIARRCQEHRAVARVRHLSLPDDPGHALATAQMSSFGAIVGVQMRGGAQAAEAVAAGTRLWLHATSLGGVESTLERRRRWEQESPDVPEDLLRLSVGIEDVEDLWADLSQAFEATT